MSQSSEDTVGEGGKQAEVGGFGEAEKLRHTLEAMAPAPQPDKPEGLEASPAPPAALDLAGIRHRIAGIGGPDDEPGEALAEEPAAIAGEGPPPEALDRAAPSTLAERHPDWPHVKIRAFLSAHRTAGDMQGLDGALDGANAYFPESIHEGRSELLFSLRAMSMRKPRWHLPGYMNRYVRRNKVGEKPIEGTVYETQLRAVYGKDLEVGSIDVKATDAVHARLAEKAAAAEQVPDRLVPVDVNYDDNLDNYGEYIGELARDQAERERAMPGNLEEQLGTMLKKRRKLRRKTELTAVISLGSYHTGAIEELRAAGFDVEVVQPEGDEPESYRDELMRGLARGERPELEAVAQAVMEDVIHSALRRRGGEAERHRDQQNYAYKVTSAFDEAEMREVYEVMQADESGGFDALDEFLERKGLGRVPRSGDELKSALEALSS